MTAKAKRRILFCFQYGSERRTTAVVAADRRRLLAVFFVALVALAAFYVPKSHEYLLLYTGVSVRRRANAADVAISKRSACVPARAIICPNLRCFAKHPLLLFACFLSVPVPSFKLQNCVPHQLLFTEAFVGRRENVVILSPFKWPRF